MPLSCTKFEYLPDEMLLEICRYLHSGDVLYSFSDLNSRLNQTITFYRQHISLHRTYYLQFVHIFENLLPTIEYSIQSLVIFELESPLFVQLFSGNHRYMNLKKLTLVNWTDEKLSSFVSLLNGMKSFEKLVLQALDITDLIDNKLLFQTLLQTNDCQLKQLIFDHECDSLQLTNDNHFHYSIFPNLIHLNIELRTTTDLFQLVDIVPNLQELNITFKYSWTKIQPERKSFSFLKKFSVYAMSWFSTFEDLKTLVQISSALEYLSLVLVTHDYLLIDKRSIDSILPLNVSEFHYSICYQTSNNQEQFDPSGIIDKWKPIPINYSLSKHDSRFFLHTKFYQSSRLSLRSLFNQNMSAIYPSEIYKNVRHVHIYDTTNLIETFGIIRHCRKILDLIISTRTLPTNRTFLSEDSSTKKEIFQVPKLTSLDFLSIQGALPDLRLIEQVFSSAPNLSAMSIDFDCLYQLLIDDEQTLLLYYLFSKRILILCLRFEETKIEKLTSEHIDCISRIFHRINHMCMDFRNSKIEIESHLISLVLNHFHKLMVLSIYGKLSNTDTYLQKEFLGDYLIQNSTGRLKRLECFHLDYGNERVKVWM